MGDNVNTTGTCVTVTVRVSPPPVTVTVPVRVAVPVLAAALMTNEPLPVRLAGVTPDTVSHVTLLLGAVHVMLDVTSMVVLSPVDGMVHVAGDNTR